MTSFKRVIKIISISICQSKHNKNIYMRKIIRKHTALKEDTTKRDNKYSPGIEGKGNKWDKSCSKSGLMRQGKLNYI